MIVAVAEDEEPPEGTEDDSASTAPTTPVAPRATVRIAVDSIVDSPNGRFTVRAARRKRGSS